MACACLSALLVSTSVCAAEEGAETTPAPVSCPSSTLGPAMPAVPDRSQSPVVLYARQLSAGQQKEGEARGNVELTRADQYMATELLLFDPVAELVTVPGPIEYRDQQVWLRGEEARYSLIEESGYFSAINYGVTGSSARGYADWVELLGGHTSRLHGLNYTTCPGEKPDWQLLAKELELQHEEGRGSARGAKLEFKGIPILYVPWFTFPIDDRRKTGFLYPGIGHSSDQGLELSIPWYWNIAPNQDMTLEPRWFSERGLMLTGDYRLMTKFTKGSIDFDYMPEDQITNEERYRYEIRHTSQPSARWGTDLLFSRVSDEQYFQDYGTNFRQTAKQFLRSNATLTGVGRYWNFQLMADAFQVIDESVKPKNEPYRRLPRIAFWMDQPVGSGGLTLGLDAEMVSFDRDIGVTGERIDLYPNLYWDRYNRWGFVKPRIGYRYRAYHLDYKGETGEESPDAGTTIASLDAGLVFDRATSDGGYQTLEPRLFYLYVPYEDQNDLPVFDTGEFTFGFSQFFNSNRFAGGDRVGDTNQLSLAVSTQKFDSHNGSVVWSLGVGQIFYFDDRRVQLDNAPTADADLSPFLAEFTWYVSPRFSTVAGTQWDWDTETLDLAMLGLRYSGGFRQQVAFEYRYRDETVDQFDFRINWPISNSWYVISRINYSFADEDILELQGGFQYESCCWAVRTVLRRYLKNREGDYRDSIYLEFNLKGLSSIGSGMRDLF